MCDENDNARFDAALARRGLSRREFAAMGTAVLAWACSPTGSNADERGATSGTEVIPLSEDRVSIATPDGQADAFFVHPAKDDHPAVLLWTDIAGLREAFKAMARRLAREGYGVLIVNPYYRWAKSPQWDSFAEWMDKSGVDGVALWREKLTKDAISSDAKAAIGWLVEQPGVDTSAGVGTMGFCMGGPFAMWTASAVPEWVRAVATFHGSRLVAEGEDSPHRSLSGSKAAYLIAIARNDDEKDPTADDTLRDAAKAAGRPAEIEVYPADHGWMVADSPVYAESPAEGAWQRLLVLFSENLRHGSVMLPPPEAEQPL
ncbi:MAG: dienelactone hydrolase family protein [Novosphingobium sp.]